MNTIDNSHSLAARCVLAQLGVPDDPDGRPLAADLAGLDTTGLGALVGELARQVAAYHVAVYGLEAARSHVQLALFTWTEVEG